MMSKLEQESTNTLPYGLAEAPGLSRLAQIAEELSESSVASDARQLLARIREGRFFVACIGQFKRGKSTLLNALVGDSVLPTGVVPVTTVPTALRYGEQRTARVLIDDSWRTVRIEELSQYVSEERNPENKKRVAGVEVFLPSSLLATGMCLVDTPGIGSVFAGNSLDAEQGFRARSRFFFHDLITIGHPASPLLYLADALMGVLHVQRWFQRDADRFLAQLLDTNASRVQGDVEQRVVESRLRLESEVRRLLREVSTSAEVALCNAREILAAGTEAVASELDRLVDFRKEVMNLNGSSR